MRRRLRIVASLILLFTAGALAQRPASANDPVERTRREVVAFFAKMADLTCTEDVTQEKFRNDGHVETSARSRYDYLIMVQASHDDFAMNESRIEAAGAPHKPLPLLVTNGFSMLLLVFHPYYQDSFRFEPGTGEMVDGSMLLPIHFSHIPGARSPAALDLRGRVYPLDFEGTAWVDQQSWQIAKMDATLARDLSDVGLRSLHIRVDYKPSSISGALGMALPERAVIDLETPRQHWRNTHLFTGYKGFSTAAEQTSTVKVVRTEPAQETSGTPSPQTTSPREQHELWP